MTNAPEGTLSDPQARAAEVLAAHRSTDERDENNLPMCSCGHRLGWSEAWDEHVAAALAEAGLLADLETRRFGAIFDDLDAARAELAEVKAVLAGERAVTAGVHADMLAMALGTYKGITDPHAEERP